MLKPSSILSFNDDHMKEADIISAVTKEALFRLKKKSNKPTVLTKFENIFGFQLRGLAD